MTAKYAYGTEPFRQAYANVAASATASTVVAAVPGRVIHVLAVAFVCGATATNATFNSASTAISPLIANAANGGAIFPYNEGSWFKTVAGEALTLTTGTGATTGVLVTYMLRG